MTKAKPKAKSAATKQVKSATPPNAGKGRKKGSRNKTTTALKEAILQALDEEGGVTYLREVARKDRKAFCALLGKVLPLTLAGDKDNPLQVEVSPTADRIIDALKLRYQRAEATAKSEE